MLMLMLMLTLLKILVRENSIFIYESHTLLILACRLQPFCTPRSIFEAYALGGASVIIHVLSDNANRANSDVSNIVNKRKFKMAESGSVLFMYDKFGLLSLEGKVDEEQLMDIAIEAGVDDIIVEEGIESADGGATTDVFTDASSIAALRDGVMSAFSIDDPLEIKLVYKSKAPVEVSDEEFEMNMAAIDALEDLDDVSHVEHNMSN